MAHLSETVARPGALPGRHPERSALAQAFRRCRARTDALTAPLGAEDQQLQSMPDCSPTKWHRGHTTWFFETFLLLPHGHAPVHPGYARIFNSYYEALGERHARPQRGMLSRPTCEEVGAYRSAVDAAICAWLETLDEGTLPDAARLLRLGIAHEEQHQELILTDILHALSLNPLKPVYRRAAPCAVHEAPPDARWVNFDGGLAPVGHAGTGFSFDNEGPAHQVWLAPYALADRLVTVGQWKAFARDDGYRRASLWLSEGLDWVRTQGIEAPLHARREGEDLVCFTLHGERVAQDDEPLLHISYYEADAIARFLGARLPTEFEWEHAAVRRPVQGQLLDDAASGPLCPTAVDMHDGTDLHQLFGSAWEWTQSAYAPYPRYRPDTGALGEYNGKFMVNQNVLRGGSFATPAGHIRASYRNFWPAHTRFQFAGLRLARDLDL